MKFPFRNKLVRYVVVPIIALAMIVVLGGGWYFACLLEEDGLRVDNALPENSVTVSDVSPGRITLRRIPGIEEDNFDTDAQWGITDGKQMYGRLGSVISAGDDSAVREFELFSGVIQQGDELYLDRTAFPHDPGSAHGLAYENVLIPGPLGDFGAWHIAGESNTWAVLVHGRTSNRETSMKLLDEISNLGVHSLAIDYRNDLNAPPSESGYYDFGTTEWEDVEAAVRYALKNGADKIVLVGFSMGGGIVVNYQLKSELADHTVGLFLDSPMLNFGRTVDKGAAERSVPPLITSVAKRFASLRFGIDWEALDFLSQADKIDVPVLLIHGDADNTVPIETSIEFAESSPHFVQLHGFKDVGHVAAWNHHPLQYRTLFKEFVERVR
ncbi:alpha/beta hydrolase [Candidatus Lucifugimonas marina]|uniref:Alpha/beta fold hydrolase n=1 Tax=Candidatus Lucifugimonas marina TaxID=3038979 RepID=A0AAJ5ZIT3_9CHLR|nr:alpha/beta fold hydrolase [SAR202 cluster bacterium JH702]MDG0870211.1 alpha/beta fold hydrolase [SAR202 cluster bacterium JH639]WFG36224.1 alpha/beta fold hydrolase [SAR202 cluster bacterium JH545]WFG40170.1 alpha/beta fold hydrolase [SAR202 cluster bacterium JH1073]